MLARGLLGLWLALVVAGCGSGPAGHWTDPGTRLVDGMWIGPQIGCPPTRDECVAIAIGGQLGLPVAERSQVKQVAWVSLPTHFVTNAGEPRTPRIQWGIDTLEAALVTLADGSQRVIGLGCVLPYTSNGVLTGGASCQPFTLTDWQDGAVPKTYPPGTTFG
jgi:hypothetical protein